MDVDLLHRRLEGTSTWSHGSGATYAQLVLLAHQADFGASRSLYLVHEMRMASLILLMLERICEDMGYEFRQTGVSQCHIDQMRVDIASVHSNHHGVHAEKFVDHYAAQVNSDLVDKSRI